MTRMESIRQQTSELTICEKLELAAELLDCLPPILDEEDDGLAEAERRGQELDENPDIAISWEQLRKGVGR